MAIEFECPACDATVRVRDDAAGKKGRCPKCRTLLLVPEPGPEETPPANAPSEALPNSPAMQGVNEAPVSAAPESIPAVSAPIANEVPFPLAPEPVRASLTARRRRRSSTGAIVSVFVALAGLAAVIAAAWLLYGDTGPDLDGQLAGERLAEVELAPVVVPLPAGEISADVAEVLEDGLPLRSPYIDVHLSRADGGLRVTVEVGPRAAAVRVPLGAHAGMKTALARERTAILAVKQEELRTATAGLLRDYETHLRNRTPISRLHEYRDQVALNACVGPLGYAVEAVISGHPFPCVYEDGQGNCYFFPPSETRTFRIRGRKLPNGGTPLPVDFEVVLREAAAGSRPAASTGADGGTEPRAVEEPAAEELKDGA